MIEIKNLCKSFEIADGKISLHGVLIEIDAESKKAVSIERIKE